MFSQTAAIQRSHAFSAIQILGASLFIALSAHISVYLPFTPVPLTGHTLAVLMIGATLGSRKGLLSVLTYICEGMIGLPVFAGGAISPLAIIGPTGGYIAGMLAQAYIVGWFTERKEAFSLSNLISGCLVGVTVQMTMGVLWLAHFVGINNVLALGLVPFIPGEMIKIAIVSVCLSRSNKNA